ncbi:MAG TPA: NAD(P)/FAD-dependent oxidoreductase [Caulobacteraceae bacterium]|nr:NAD(P)/FAD-dependent oxidoreductase [Caulobacteraceae bacterium]
MDAFDVIVVGAGPGGLTAATYLARFRRRVAVLDGGVPRAAMIPESHNTPGFPAGISGPELIERLKAQALEYGVEMIDGRAERLMPRQNGFDVQTQGRAVQAAFVVLAAGIKDLRPAIAGVEDAIRRALVRVCPICDGFEASGQRIAVLGDDDLGSREALFLRTYSDRVTLLYAGDPDRLAGAGELRSVGVGVRSVEVEDIEIAEQAILVRDASPEPETFDCLYLALGCDLHSHLPTMPPLARDEDGSLVVDPHQQTSIDGLYAVGDIVRGLNQIAVATGEAAIAATRIHRRLRERDSAQRGQGGAPGS